MRERMVSLSELLPLRQQWQKEGWKLVFTNGIFDLLHSGHVAYLEEARALGDRLIVGVNSDASTRMLKGPTRPLIAERERVYLLAALRCVDYVTLFQETTAEALVATLRPDIYVKGGDYTEEHLPEAHIVRAYGGNVVLLAYHEGFSTTALIKRIVATFG